MRLRNPLAVAHNLGTARDGVAHWWVQRFTAILLIPLTIWLVWALFVLVGAEHAAVAAWLGRPWNAAMAILFVVMMFYHNNLGLQIVIEDYVHHRLAEVTLQLLVKSGSILGGLLATLAILKLSLGG